jgi:hypothetical protein
MTDDWRNAPPPRTWRKFDPAIPCQVCRGTGKTYVEHEDGSLSEIECRYCKGRKDSTWVDERFWARQGHNRWKKAAVVVYFLLLLETNGLNFWSLSGDGPAWGFALHIAAWFVGFLGLYWWVGNTRARKHRKQASPRTVRCSTGVPSSAVPC